MSNEQVEVETQEAPEAPINNGTLREELTAALKASAEAKEATEEVAEDATKDAPEETTEEATEEVVEDTEEDDPIAKEVEDKFPLAPKDMSEEEREVFQGILESDDEEVRTAGEILVERYNNLKKGFYAKSKEFSEKAKEFEEINQVFKPFEQSMQQNGISKQQYMLNMIQWENSLANDPVNTVKNIMQRYNVNPQDLGVNNDYDYDDNYDITDNKEIDELKKQINGLQNQLVQVTNQPALTQLEQFKTATDPQTGELKHPMFEQVAPIMGTLIQTKQASTLEDAYSKAIKAIGSESSVSETAVDVNAIKKKVAQARKASKAVSNKGGSRVDYSKMTVREELAAKMNKA